MYTSGNTQQGFASIILGGLARHQTARLFGKVQKCICHWPEEAVECQKVSLSINLLPDEQRPYLCISAGIMNSAVGDYPGHQKKNNIRKPLSLHATSWITFVASSADVCVCVCSTSARDSKARPCPWGAIYGVDRRRPILYNSNAGTWL